MANEPAPEPSDSSPRVDPRAVLQGAAGTDLARIAPGRTWALRQPGPRPSAPAPDARQALLTAGGAILDTGASVDAWTDATHAPVWVHVDDPLAGIDPADFLAQRRLHGGAGALLWAAPAQCPSAPRRTPSLVLLEDRAAWRTSCRTTWRTARRSTTGGTSS